MDNTTIIALCGKGGVVVENERDSCIPAEWNEGLGDAADGGKVMALGPELE